ncbi:CPBP family glutamic-type intramembrane protease [Paucilactobacillus suebicus]|uniref:Abortive infection protein n=1 Tax=Paucilactobacillus suebicus DSM 5007 = KCTC 3549 TaxID=1423807 RepID=A0A0R1W1M4_9LACO|nr:CPBP family glutamic-type intramembrane protease [Paucilactobacillus suebicus]KRM11626.1 abortive infection protein [Paucilactobacillus suebicus DSM 5007 = KCTC 3549]
MRKHWPLFYIFSIVLALFFIEIGQIVSNVIFKLGLSSTGGTIKVWNTVCVEVIVFVIWWLFNKVYLKAKIGWRSSGRSWCLLLPVVVVLIGDSTLGASYNLAGGFVIASILSGLAVGLAEEYLFRGIMVSYLYSHFRIGAATTACLSAIAFGLIHSINGLSSGNWNNTIAQVIMAVGLGFFLATVYLVTNNLWIPIVFHGVIDAFDQIAFGTLSNSAGTSMVTGVIYFVVFIILGGIVISRGSVKLARGNQFSVGVDRRPLARADFSGRAEFGMGSMNTNNKISPIKTIIAIILPPLELALGAVLINPGQSKAAKAVIAVGMAFIVFLVAIFMYKDVLKRDWVEYKRHLIRNFFLNILGVILAYVILAVVRIGMRSVLGASAMPNDSMTMLSIQTAAVTTFASLTVLMAPFTEEIIFRHVLFCQWRNRNGLLTVVMLFVSSIAFGLVHWNNFNGDVTQMVPYMVIGAFFALIYYFTKNIWQNIMTHFWFDFLQFAASLFLLIFAIIQH